MAARATPTDILERELDGALRRIRDAEVGVACGGAVHRIRFDGDALCADHHDPQDEAVLQVIGGQPPPCMRAVDALTRATSAVLWFALATKEAAGGDDAAEWPEQPLCALPAAHLRVFLARALAAEFACAGQAARAHVARLGLALVAPAPRPAEALEPAFQLTRELPRWNIGPVTLSDRELVLIGRWIAPPEGASGPRLRGLPKDPVARRAVARYLAWLLGSEGMVSKEQMKALLPTGFPAVHAVVNLMVSEGVLERTNGGYRAHSPGTG